MCSYREADETLVADPSVEGNRRATERVQMTGLETKQLSPASSAVANSLAPGINKRPRARAAPSLSDKCPLHTVAHARPTTI